MEAVFAPSLSNSHAADGSFGILDVGAPSVSLFRRDQIFSGIHIAGAAQGALLGGAFPIFHPGALLLTNQRMLL
jgi:hypothetical protein